MWPGVFPSRNLPLDRGLLTWAFCTTTWIFMQKNRSPGTRSFSDLCGWVSTLFSWGQCLAARISIISYVRKIDDTLDSRLGWIWWCGGWANGLGIRCSVSMRKAAQAECSFWDDLRRTHCWAPRGKFGGQKIERKKPRIFWIDWFILWNIGDT